MEKNRKRTVSAQETPGGKAQEQPGKSLAKKKQKTTGNNLKIKPEQGLLLAWNNLYRNGKPNYKTMHEALPPKKGQKYVKLFQSWLKLLGKKRQRIK